jgi:predicted metal-binding protein
MPAETVPATNLSSYSARWKGLPLLVCSKCQRKLKHSSDHPLKLKKVLKKLAKNDSDRRKLHVLSVSCMKLCPKGGITVCTPQQFSHTPPTVTIVYTEADAESLYQLCKTNAP